MTDSGDEGRSEGRPPQIRSFFLSSLLGNEGDGAFFPLFSFFSFLFYLTSFLSSGSLEEKEKGVPYYDR